jgi:hypothetical protein
VDGAAFQLAVGLGGLLHGHGCERVDPPFCMSACSNRDDGLCAQTGADLRAIEAGSLRPPGGAGRLRRCGWAVGVRQSGEAGHLVDVAAGHAERGGTGPDGFFVRPVKHAVDLAVAVVVQPGLRDRLPFPVHSKVVLARDGVVLPFVPSFHSVQPCELL